MKLVQFAQSIMKDVQGPFVTGYKNVHLIEEVFIETVDTIMVLKYCTLFINLLEHG